MQWNLLFDIFYVLSPISRVYIQEWGFTVFNSLPDTNNRLTYNFRSLITQVGTL